MKSRPYDTPAAQTSPNELIPHFARSGMAAGISVAAVGAGHLIGWLSGYFSTRIFNEITMKTNTAVGLVLSGISVLLLIGSRNSGWSKWTVRACAVAVSAIGLLSFGENLLGLDFGIDQLIATEIPGAPGVLSPNRMGSPAALAFALTGLALLFFSAAKHVSKIAQNLSLAVLLLGLLGTLGFIYEVRPLYSLARFTTVAFPTTASLCLLGFAMLCVKPAEGWMAAITVKDAGGQTIRRLLPWCIFLPLIIGSLKLVGERNEIFDSAMGTALVMLLLVCILCALVYLTGTILSKGEAERARAAEALQAERAKLRAILDSIPLAVWIADPDGRIQDTNEQAKAIWGELLPSLGTPADYAKYKAWWPDTGMALRAEDWAVLRAMSKGETIVGEELDIQRFDGTYRTVLNNAAPIKDPSGRIIGGVVIEQDITERKRSEEALRESRTMERKRADQLALALRRHGEILAQLNSLLENAPIGFAFFDREHRYVRINKFLATDINGLPVEAHLGRPIREVLPVNAIQVEPLLERAFASGEPLRSIEVTGETPASPGERRHWLTGWFPVRTPDGKIPWVGAVVVEVTQQLRTQEALRESERKFRAIFEQAAIGMGRVRFTDARWIDVNEAFCSMLGYSQEELLSIPWPEMTHPEDVDLDLIPFGQMAEGQIDRYTVEKRFIHKGGQPVWARLTLSLVRDASGRPEYEIAIIENITDRKKAEEALRHSEQRLRAIFDSAGVGLVEVEGNDRFIAANSMACQVLGRAREELLTMNVHDLTWPEDRGLSDRINEELHAGRSDRIAYEKRYIRGDGTPVWVHVTVSALRDQQGAWARSITTIEDITERKRAEQDLAAAKTSAEQARAEAEEANRAKDHFLAVLSHELRTPLTPVVMGISMLQDTPGLDPRVCDTLEMIRQNVEMEARLIDDLLDVTRIARGKIELNRRRVELGKVIERAVEVCKPDIEARKLHFSADLRPGVWVEADPSRLQQVFWNLLKNAIKFTPNGGCVGIRCHPNQKHVLVEVSDSGIGIEPEGLPRVFDAFEQAERSITRQFGGLGLGLAISKALVEMHGGEIGAQSQGRDKGATFRVRLPMTAPADPSVAPAAPPKRSAAPLRILLVEDHGTTARMIRMVLKEKGHSVDIAGDIATALRMAEQQDFDLLLSDLGLPDGSGHDLLKELRSRGCKFPAIALSGYGQEDDVRRSYEAGFTAHLTKPASREAMDDAIASATSGREQTVPTRSEQLGVPVFDEAKALERCYGQREMLREMIRYFPEESGEAMGRIQVAMKDGDLAEAGRAAHRLKNSLVYLGAQPAVDAAIQLEQAANSGNSAEAAEAVLELERQVSALKTMLDAHLKKPDEPEGNREVF